MATGSDRGIASPRRNRYRVLAMVIVGLCAVTALIAGQHRHRLRRAESLIDTSPTAAADAIGGDWARAMGLSPEAELLLCRALCRQGRLRDAQDCLSDVTLTRCQPESLVRFAAYATSSGQFEWAYHALLAARRPDESSPEILRGLINVSYELGRRQETLGYCKELSRLQPDDPIAWHVRYLIAAENQEFVEAIAACREVLKRHPPSEREPREDLVSYLILVGDAAEARQELNVLLQDRPSAKALLSEVKLLRMEGKEPEALAAADKLVEAYPPLTEAQMLRGVLRLGQGDVTGAVGDLERAVSEDPTNSETRFLLGQAYAKGKMPDRARDQLDRAQKLGAIQQGIRTLEYQLGQQPDNADIRERIAAAYRDLNQLASE